MENAYSESLTIELDHPSRDIDEGTLEQLIHSVLEAEGASLRHLSVVLSHHERVRELNRDFLDHDYNTDVLSFPLRELASDDSPVVEGEVYVDLDTAAERHREFDSTFEEEVRRYVVHGLLHLLGYDDKTESGRNEMRDREDQYLEAFSRSSS